MLTAVRALVLPARGPLAARFALASLGVMAAALIAPGQQPPAPPGRNDPILRLEAGGPTAYVAAMAFSPDGKTLYAAGYDKVVRAWGLNEETGRFELDQRRHYRVPIYPGMDGAINAIAVSGDGNWLAVGGLGAMRGRAEFAEAGRLDPVPAHDDKQRLDRGVIYVFSTTGQEIKRLYGHRRPVVSLAFAPAAGGAAPILVSAAEERGDAEVGQKSADVRVWNVSTEQMLGELTNLPKRPDGLRAPGLAAMRTGAQPNQVRVAIAWGDSHVNAMGNSRGYLRVWDVAGPQGRIEQVEEGSANATLLQLPGGGVISGSFAANQGQLKTWDIGARPPQLQSQTPLPAPANSYFFPDALALSAKNHAAVVVRRVTNKGADLDSRLLLLELPLGGASKIVHQISLGADGIPVLAAVPGGAHIAVTGTSDHAIRVYAVADLLKANEKVAYQSLQSAGSSMRSVSFVTPKGGDGKRLGLALSAAARPQGQAAVLREGDLVCDFDQRKLADQIQDWTPAAPDSGPWQAQVAAGEPGVIRVLEGKQAVAQIKIDPAQSRHVWALLPPRAPLQTPLLALAGYVTATSSPRLDLYNARTGAHLRRFEGHAAPINSLAFSPDGRLLASAANDQTVCVWALTDLGEVLDRHGRLPGVAVVLKDKAVVVDKVEDDSPAKGRLEAGSIILGQVVDNELKPLPSPSSFYETFWMVRPNTAVTLRVRTGQQVKDVAVTAGQGIDGRKPLFTLFVADQREWLGWSPVGPFDASGPAAEKYAGWHFNTGNAAEPTKFALLNQYHERFYKKNLLKHLVAEGSLGKALEKHKEAAGPRPGVKIQEPLGAARAANGDFVLRERQVQFAILDFTRQAQDVVEWQLNDGPAQALDAPVGNLWTVSLAQNGAQGRRDRVRVRVQLHEAGKPPTTFTQEWTVRYQPAAPRLVFEPQGARPDKDPGGHYDTATTPDYAFRAKLETPGEGPRCKLTFWLNDQKMPSEQHVDRAEEPQTIAKSFTLKAGDNLIKVVAQNDPALAGFEDDERHTLTVKVFHKASAPVIVVRRIEPIDEEEGPVKFETAQQVVVQVPRVRIVGAIMAQSEIASAAWQDAARPQSAKLADFKAGQREIAFSQEVELRPGLQTIRILAKAESGPEGVESVPLLYRPQLPGLVLKAPERVVRDRGDGAGAQIVVETQLVPPRIPGSEPQPLQALVVHNGKAGAPIDLDSAAKALPPQKLRLTPGPNQVSVLLNHTAAWKGAPASAEFSVDFVAPPRVTGLRHRPVGTTPFVNLTADVRSKSPLLEGSVKVFINDRPRPYGSAQFKKADDAGAWIVEVADVALLLEENKVEQTNGIKLQLSNAEAQSELSEPVTVVYKEAPPPLPRIELVSPSSAADANLPGPEVSLVFRVHSTKPLKRVTVSREDQVLFQPAKLEPSASGVYQFNTPKLPLDWNSNVLKIEAMNDGGPQVALLTLSVAAQPVELVLDSLRIDDRPTAATVKSEVLSDGTRRFVAVPKGRVLLEGKVRWGGQDDELFKRPHDVRIYVNGFQQVPAKLAAATSAKPRERSFKTWVVLNLAENTIEASLPSLPPDERSRKKCAASCQKPNRGQDLHIVFVAPEAQAPKSKALRERMIRALQAVPVERNLYKTPMSFDVLHFHERRELSAPDVSSLLVSVRGILARRAAAGSPNDVVMVYSFAPDAAPSGLKRSPLDLNQLESNHFAHFNGAQVLFLDQRGAAAEAAALEREFRLALFRHIHQKDTEPTPLLQGLEAEMPRATWLDELRPFLKERLQAGTLLTYYPEGLKMQLNPSR
jgi:WD40 repeat protein